MNVHRRVFHIVLTALFAFSICGEALAQHKNFILVIDPGHGGEDPGAISGRYLEKELNLEVSLALGALIRRDMSDVDVLYTRTDDRAVGLAARGDFANRAGADLFLSIHTNSFRNGSTSGSETYVMGMDKSEANLEVAKLENEVIRYEEDYTETYAGFDPNSTELSIIFGMLQYAHFESSIGFARLIQKHYTAETSLRDRGAKQGPFAVLWKPTMPRVLTEMGFISNDSDRRYIFSDNGKEAIVKALYEAFREYKEQVGARAATLPSSSSGQPGSSAPATTPPARSTTPAPNLYPPATTTQTEPDRTSPPTTTGETATRDQSRAIPPVPAVQFRIQLAATRNPVSTDDATWGPYRGRVIEIHTDGWYKYSLGPYSTRSEAEAALGAVRRTKFSGAFITEVETNVKK